MPEEPVKVTLNQAIDKEVAERLIKEMSYGRDIKDGALYGGTSGDLIYGFSGLKDGKYTEFVTNIHPEYVWTNVEYLKAPQDRQLFVDLLKDTELLTKSLQAKLEKSAELASRIEEVQKIGQKEQRIDLSGDDDIGVFQADVVYTDPDAKQPILASFGAQPCVIVAAHNPETGVTAMAHIDAMTDLKSVYGMMYGVKGDAENATVEVHLAGATQNSGGAETLGGIIDILDRLDYVEIKSADVSDHDQSEALAIDARTGKVFTEFDPKNVPIAGAETQQEFDMKAQMVGMSFQKRRLSTAYDGRGVDEVEQNFIDDLRGVFSAASLSKGDFVRAAGSLSYQARQYENVFESGDYNSILDKTVEMFPQLEEPIGELRDRYEDAYTVDGIESANSAGRLKRAEATLANDLKNILEENSATIPIDAMEEYDDVLRVLHEKGNQIQSDALNKELEELSKELEGTEAGVKLTSVMKP